MQYGSKAWDLFKLLIVEVAKKATGEIYVNRFLVFASIGKASRSKGNVMLTRKYKKSFDDLLKYLKFNNISYRDYQKELYKKDFTVVFPDWVKKKG